MATNHNFRIKNGLEVGGTVIVSPDGVMTIPTSSVGSTQDGGTNNTRLATTAFVQQELTTLIGGAPSTLNDLNELAAAINDDANYNSTLTTALATKLPLAGGTLTGHALFTDGVELRLGTDTDMGLFSSSGTSHIRVNSGIFKLRADDMRFTAQNGTTERGRFNSAGLTVSGDINAAVNVNTGRAIRFDYGAGYKDALQQAGNDVYLDAHAGVLYIRTSGNVLAATFTGANTALAGDLGVAGNLSQSISTAGTNNNLSLRNTNAGATALTNINLGTDLSTATATITTFSEAHVNAGKLLIHTGANRDLVLGTNGVDRFTINGINGGVTLSSTLGVSGTATFTGDVYAGGATAAYFSSAEAITAPTAGFKSNSATVPALFAGNATADGPIIKLMDAAGTSRGVFSVQNSTAKTLLTTGGFKVVGNQEITGTLGVNGTISATGSITTTDGSGSFGISGDGSSNTYLSATGEIRVRPSGTSVNKFVIGSNGNVTTAGTINSGTVTSSGIQKFTKSVYGAEDSENYYRIKLQDQGGVSNDVGIGQHLSGSMGFNVTQNGEFRFNEGTDGIVGVIGPNGVDARQGGFRIGTTTVISASRNITMGSSLTVEADGSTNYTSNHIRFMSHNTARGAGHFLMDDAGANTWYTGTAYSDAFNNWGVHYKAANEDEETAHTQRRVLTVGKTGNLTAAGALYFSSELHGSSKKIFSTGDSYLRMNQSSEFSAGVWLGTSTLMTSTGFIAAGSNGGTTTSRVYIKSGSYNGSNVIAIDGTNGTITAVGINVNGNVEHQGLTMTAGTDIDQIYTAAKTLTITTSFADTGIDASDLQTGTYLVQLQCNDHAIGGAYSMIYSGTMSWTSGDTNDVAVDEIVLHRAGHASVGKNLFLRVQYTATADVNNLKLQIRGNYAATGSSTYTFKFRRMI